MMTAEMGPGDRIADRLEIEQLAGTVGMGAVYRARDSVTGERVAVKVLHGPSREAHERFAREARVLAGLQHANIVRFVAHGESAAGVYLAMQWLDGEDLESRLKK